MSFQTFFLQFWLWTVSFISEPQCWTLKSWVFLVNKKQSLSEPEKLKISVFSTTNTYQKKVSNITFHLFLSVNCAGMSRKVAEGNRCLYFVSFVKAEQRCFLCCDWTVWSSLQPLDVIGLKIFNARYWVQRRGKKENLE